MPRRFVGIMLGGKNVADIFQESLGLDQAFMDHLFEADDWSVMILSWALLEASLNHAIRKEIENQAVVGFVLDLPLGGGKGRVALAKDLGILDERQVRFIQTFTTIRNAFAHGVHRFNWTIESFVAQQPDPQRFRKALWSHALNDPDGSKLDLSAQLIGNVATLCVELVGALPRRRDSQQPLAATD
jgi:hypothetical protein